MKILFIGPMWCGSNALSLANGFAELGHEVRTVDTATLARPRRLSPDWVLNRIDRDDRLARSARLLARCREVARGFRPDVQVCFETTIRLDQAALLDLPAPLKISYSPDDVANPDNVTADYLAHEGEWSMAVTTKRHNVPEIEARTRGRTPVRFVLSAYDPAWHRRCAASTAACGTTSASSATTGRTGRRCRPGRDKVRAQAGRVRRRLAPARGHDGRACARRRCTARRTGSTSPRSWPVPGRTSCCRTPEPGHPHLPHVRGTGGGRACSGGQRTDEHARLLDDGSEALLFSGDDELFALLDGVTGDPARAARIAEAGWRRICADCHRYRDRAAQFLAGIS